MNIYFAYLKLNFIPIPKLAQNNLKISFLKKQIIVINDNRIILYGHIYTANNLYKAVLNRFDD